MSQQERNEAKQVRGDAIKNRDYEALTELKHDNDALLDALEAILRLKEEKLSTPEAQKAFRKKLSFKDKFNSVVFVGKLVGQILITRKVPENTDEKALRNSVGIANISRKGF